MLSKADLTRAQKIFADRDAAQRMRALVSKGIALMAGEGKDTSEIVLSATYQRKIIADVTASLDQQIADADAALTSMGVQP